MKWLRHLLWMAAAYLVYAQAVFNGSFLSRGLQPIQDAFAAGSGIGFPLPLIGRERLPAEEIGPYFHDLNLIVLGLILVFGSLELWRDGFLRIPDARRAFRAQPVPALYAGVFPARQAASPHPRGTCDRGPGPCEALS